MSYPIVRTNTSLDNDKEFRDFLSKRYGIELKICKGIGLYIECLLRSKDKVIKVLNYGDDHAYEDYLKVWLKHQHHKSFPKIYNVEIIKNNREYRYRWGQHHQYLVITMERLYHNSRKAFVIGDYAEQFGNDWISVRRAFPSKKTISASLRTMEKAGLFKKYTKDMHEGNIMFRKNGEAVLIDPLCQDGL